MRFNLKLMSMVVAVGLLGSMIVACTPAATPTAAPTKAAAAATPTAAAKPATTAAPAASPTSAAPAATPAATTAPAAAAKEPEDKPLSPPITVKVGLLPIMSGANIYTAIEKGFFKDQGVNIELINFDTAARMIAPLTTGELYLGAGATSAGFYNALQRGLPIKVVADWNSATQPSTLALVARKDLVDSGKIKDYADLKGKTVSINATGVFSEIILDQALKKGGLTMKDVNVVLIPFEQVPAAMANKSVDVSLTNEPFVTMGPSQGTYVRWKDVQELDPGRTYSVIMYSPIFARDNAEAAKRWMLGYIKGIRYYQNAIKTKEGKAEIVTILDKYIGAKPPGFYDQIVFPFANPDGYVNAKTVSGDMEWYFANGQIKEKADMSTVIDNQFVDYAIRKLGRNQ